MHKLLTIVAVVAALLSVGCAQKEAPATQYRGVTDIHQTMLWILEPAADVIWHSAGFIITAQGEQDLTPTTVESWQKVVNAAAVVAESGNLLMMPSRAAGDDWLEYAGGLVEAGTVALEAAQKQDGEALFAAGGQIYQVCLACHSQYIKP